MRRTLVLSVSLILGAILTTARPVSAAFIGLTTPVSGTSQPGDVIDLTVSFDLNGAAANLVSSELYVAFTGLVPVAGSYQLGSLFTPVIADVLALDGLCATGFCNYPITDPNSPDTYQSLINLFAPSVVTGPGTLFTMQFTLAPGFTNWSLNLFGDDGFGLFSDPLPQACDPNDPNCVPDPVMAAIPYGIFLPIDVVASGLARVNVGVTAPPAPTGPPSAVPEPTSLVLFGTGLLILTARRRRR